MDIGYPLLARHSLINLIKLLTTFFAYIGPSAFDSWTYCVNYSVVGDDEEESNCTSNLQTTLYGLQSSTLYQFTLSAIGPGGERVAPDTFVFQTKDIGMLTNPTVHFGSVECT